MPDLGELLSHAERALENGFDGRAASVGGVARAKALIRRRRAVRQWGQGAVAAVAVVGVVGGGTWLGSSRGEPTVPAGTTTGTQTQTQVPTPAPTHPADRAATAPVVPPGTSTGTSTGTATGAGCRATGGGIPAGADVHEVVDVDGDGRADRAWISVDRAGDSRRFGVTTASGATFSIAIDDASPLPASAVVQLVQSDGVPIALVDLHRQAHLYSLAGCAVTAVLNAQGQPYLFDRGFGDQGTGVGCTDVDGVLRLAGLDAVRRDDGRYDVSRTYIDLDADGRHATNEKRVVVAKGVAQDARVVVTAGEVSCGELLAGRDGPVEPVP